MYQIIHDMDWVQCFLSAVHGTGIGEFLVRMCHMKK